MRSKIVKPILRFSLAAGILSAIADRFGLWPLVSSVGGTKNIYFAYTKLINPLAKKN